MVKCKTTRNESKKNKQSKKPSKNLLARNRHAHHEYEILKKFERKRKLLLHKKQIRELERAVSQKGMALVPLEIYFDANNHVKVQIAIARGKKLHDKRQAMAERDSKREISRAMKFRSR